ncbi:putative F-box protein [Hirschfeldia incana]|nr:putative F-box protein [Hirschfeldia incana]
MEMEEKPKPNSHDHLIGKDTPVSWSDLPQDLLSSIFERLTFANFQRAKAVCSSWYSSSKQCLPKKQIHWLILFPEDNENNNNHSCTLFNPEERDKLHKTQDLGLYFAKSCCIATYGSWLLMQYPLCRLYVVNLFTNERINLPSVESQIGMAKIERTLDGYELRTTSPNEKVYKGISIRTPVFWIDERTSDYVVIWGLRDLCVVYSKKGDTAWTQLPKTSGFCVDLVYKESKLYFLSLSGCFFIFDLSGETPQQIFQCGVIVERLRLGLVVPTKLVVTVTGEVFKAEKWWRSRSKTWSFRVIKICSPGFLRNHQLVTSLGHESMLLDQGITVLANEGFIKDCIYFSVIGEKTYSIFLFDLKTKKTDPLHNFDCSVAQFSRARWFLPS